MISEYNLESTNSSFFPIFRVPSSSRTIVEMRIDSYGGLTVPSLVVTTLLNYKGCITLIRCGLNLNVRDTDVSDDLTRGVYHRIGG